MTNNLYYEIQGQPNIHFPKFSWFSTSKQNSTSTYICQPKFSLVVNLTSQKNSTSRGTAIWLKTVRIANAAQGNLPKGRKREREKNMQDRYQLVQEHWKLCIFFPKTNLLGPFQMINLATIIASDTQNWYKFNNPFLLKLNNCITQTIQIAVALNYWIQR